MRDDSKMNDVVDVRHVRDYTLWLRFADGTEGEIDLSPSMKGPVFEPLRDVDYFKQVRVDPKLGTIVWPNAPTSLPKRFTSACKSLPAERRKNATAVTAGTRAIPRATIPG